MSSRGRTTHPLGQLDFLLRCHDYRAALAEVRTAGTLVGAGGGGIEIGLASSGTSAEALEGVVARQLAVAILRDVQKLDPDPVIRRALAETEIEVRRQHERLDEFSGESAPTLEELTRKTEAMVTGIVIPHETRLEIFTHEFSDLASYQDAVGGYIETIHLEGHPLVIVANEEGKVMRLPANRRATCLWWLLNPSGLGGDTLVGDVAIVGPIARRNVRRTREARQPPA